MGVPYEPIDYTDLASDAETADAETARKLEIADQRAFAAALSSVANTFASSRGK